LLSALAIAKAMSVRARTSESRPVSPKDIEPAIRQIERQVERLQEIRIKSTTIRSGAESIIEIATRMEADITQRLSILDDNVAQLKSIDG
jgi:transcriptional regulator NrdR family protein